MGVQSEGGGGVGVVVVVAGVGVETATIWCEAKQGCSPECPAGSALHRE